MLLKLKIAFAVGLAALATFLGFRSQHFKNKSMHLKNQLAIAKAESQAQKRRDQAMAEAQKNAFKTVQDEIDSSYHRRDHFE